MKFFSYYLDQTHPIKPLILIITSAIAPVNESFFVFSLDSPFNISYVKNKTIILAATKPICHASILSSGKLGTTKAIIKIKKSIGVVLNPLLLVNFSVKSTKTINTPNEKLQALCKKVCVMYCTSVSLRYIKNGIIINIVISMIIEILSFFSRQTIDIIAKTISEAIEK